MSSPLSSYKILTRNRTMSLSVHDFFCGLGGNSEGASQVNGIEIQYAVNHDPNAIKNHSLNFPTARHDCIDIRKIRAKRYEKANIGLYGLERKRHLLRLCTEPERTRV